jgi:PHD/YefM family antitoxin component YafN of YafNO toxin-antitoxin module
MYRRQEMLIETDQVMSITRLQKELTQTVRELSETGKPVYILKNNNMEAVMVPFSEYEYLTNLEEMFEYYEINNMISTRLKNYKVNDSVEWEKIKD